MRGERSSQKEVQCSLTEREAVLGPLDPARQVSYHAVDDGPATLSHEGVLWCRPEKLLLGPGALDNNWERIGVR